MSDAVCDIRNQHSKQPFRCGQGLAIRIAAQSYSNGFGKSLENRFYFVVLILAIGLNIQIAARSIAEGFEEMREHFRRHLPNLFPLEICLPNQPRPAPKINRHLRQTIVHRQTKPIPLQTKLVTECFCKRLTQRQRRILDRMMLIYMQIALHTHPEVATRVSRQLVEHVIKKTKSRFVIGLPRSVQIQFNRDHCFLRHAMHFGGTRRQLQEVIDVAPIRCFQCDEILQARNLVAQFFRAKRRIAIEPDATAAKVLRQGNVGDAVANDKGICQVVIAFQILCEHACIGFSGGCIFVWESAINVHALEIDAFVCKSLHDKILNGPKLRLRKSRRTHTILIGYKYQLVVEFLHNAREVLKNPGVKNDFFQRIHLVVFRLQYDGSVAVKKEQLLHSLLVFCAAKIGGLYSFATNHSTAMRITSFLFLLATLGFSACGGEQSAQEKLWEEVIAIHDEVMPKMGDINRISRTIRAELDTVPPIDTLLKLQQLDLLIRLGKAEEGMMVWMNELETLDELRESKSNKEIMAYLEGEKQRISAVRDSMLVSIEAGQAALEEKE